MRGNYSVAYRQRHPDAPAAVQWQAGVVVRKGSAVDLSTWSSRANWWWLMRATVVGNLCAGVEIGSCPSSEVATFRINRAWS
jgi:hypothetical protein